jgi:predicted nucleic acid-binding protein
MALDLAKRHQLALWDAQIVASARLNGCTRILSEDFQHRSAIYGVTILNPFAADFQDAEAM